MRRLGYHLILSNIDLCFLNINKNGRLLCLPFLRDILYTAIHFVLESGQTNVIAAPTFVAKYLQAPFKEGVNKKHIKNWGVGGTLCPQQKYVFFI